MMRKGRELNLHLSLAWSHDAPEKYEQKKDVFVDVYLHGDSSQKVTNCGADN
jgi:hypothetical protein